MTDSSAPPTRLFRQTAIVLLAFLVALAAGAWFLRAAYWPCGGLDTSSGCVSTAVLDVGSLGLDPGATQVEYQGFDLGPAGGVALVALKEQTPEGARIVLALFDGRTGSLLRSLAERRGRGAEAYVAQVALSADAALAAAVITAEVDGEMQTSLDVYRVADGSLVKSIWTVRGDERAYCTSMLAFSPDGRKVQCFTQVHDLESGVVETVTDAVGNFRYPIFAGFAGMDAVAPDGTRAVLADLPTPLPLFDSDRWARFTSDSASILILSRAYRENRGQRLYTPPVFRRLAAVELWDGKSRQYQRGFYANRRYQLASWSQDAALFGLISDDLHLDLFTR